MENMTESDRYFYLSTKTTDELCYEFNNTFIKSKTEKQLAEILADRGVQKCEALYKVRLIPPSPEQIAAEKEKARRIAAENAEKEKARRIAAENAEKEKARRIAAEKEKARRIAAENAEKERIAVDKAREKKAASEYLKYGHRHETLLVCDGEETSILRNLGVDAFRSLEGKTHDIFTIIKYGGKITEVRTRDNSYHLYRKNISSKKDDEPIYLQLIVEGDRLILRTKNKVLSPSTRDTVIYNTGEYYIESGFLHTTGQCYSSKKAF